MGFFSKRRNAIIEAHLEQMVKSGTSEKDVPGLFFDAACRYGQDNGGKLYDDMRDSIIFDKVLGGNNHSVFFLVGRGGKGTNITLTKRRSSLDLAREEAEAFVSDARTIEARPAPRPHPTWTSDPNITQTFIQSWTRLSVERGIPISYLEEEQGSDDLIPLLMASMAKAESQGNTFEQQVDASVDLLFSRWHRLDEQTKQRFEALG